MITYPAAIPLAIVWRVPDHFCFSFSSSLAILLGMAVLLGLSVHFAEGYFLGGLAIRAR